MDDYDNYLETRSNGVTGEMFMVDVNRYIFFAADYLWDKQATPTPVLVLECFKDEATKKEIEDFGGVKYIDTIMNQKIPKDGLKTLCNELKENFKKWQVIEVCEEESETLKKDGEVKKSTNRITQILEEIQSESAEAVYKMGTDLEAILEYRASNPQQVAGLEVGWPKYDAITGGARPGDLIVVCARAKSGKSTLLTNWAANLAYESGLPILYFDTEMSSREQEDRLVAMLSGVSYQEILNGKYAQDMHKKEAVMKAAKKIQSGLFHHVYLPNFTMEEVKAISKKYERMHGIQAIFFDYIKIPSSGSAGLKTAQEWQMLGFLTTGLKELAGTLDIPVFTACQENRNDPNGTNKSAANVGGSDRILQFCTKLMFLYNKDPAQVELAPQLGDKELYIAFQRAGQCDAPPINISFKNECLQMKEVSLFE